MTEDYYQNVCDKLTELLIRSEERIDRTNNMISSCIEMVGRLTTEYITQLDRLKETRDKILEQNTELIKSIRSKEDLLDYSNRRYDMLLEKVFGVVSKGSSENNITVK